MRVLLVLAVVVVFAAMLVFDTAALIRLTAFCVAGGCGVRPLWIAIGTGALAIVVFLSLRRPHSAAKTAPVRKKAARRAASGKVTARRKAKQAK